MSSAAARLRVVFGLLIALVAIGVVSSATASAALTHEFRNEVGAGSFEAESEPSGIAVDDQSGDVYVLDQHTGVVQKFTAAGAPAEIGTSRSNVLGSFTVLSFGGQLAVDNSGGAKDGTVYVATGEGVRAFARDGSQETFPGAGAEAEENLLKGYGNGLPLEAHAVAVDSEGDLYVGTASEIDVFDPTGKPLTALQIGGGNALGVAPSGRLYPDANYIEPEAPGTVYIRVPESYPPVENTSYENAAFELGGSHGLAVDARSEHVLVLDGTEVDEYEPTGSGASASLARVTTFGEGTLTGASRAVAVDGSDGDTYVAAGTRVLRFGPLVKGPNVVTGAATNVDSVTGTARLNGTVDPLGESVVRCEFEYGETTAYGQTAPCSGTPSGSGPQAVHADISGLTAANWHFRLVAAGPEGAVTGADATFAIAEAPQIEAESVVPGATEAKFTATINGGNGATSYFFEYGTGPGYGSRTATGTIPASSTGQTVSISIAGLAPGTEYHFHVVATNEVTTAEGADQTFVTSSSGSGGGCPNEALRQGFSALLPECRAYEMVSPVEKGGGDVFSLAGVQAAPSGEVVAYLANTAFAGAPGSAYENAYVAARGAGGWTTSSTGIPQRNTNTFVLSQTLGFGGDLGRTIEVSTLALAPGAGQGDVNVYSRDNATGALTLLQSIAGEKALTGITSPRARYFLGASSDGARVFLQTAEQFGGEGTPGGALTYNVYEFEGVTRHLISTAEGADFLVNPEDTGRQVSTDGRQVALSQEGGTGAVYLHEAGKATVPISTVQRPGPEFGEVKGGARPFVSRDGSSVVFIGPEGLAADAGEGEGSVTLFSYDTASKTLHQLFEAPAGGAQVTGILATSDDNGYVYFASGAKLTADATEGALNYYVWRRGFPAAEAIELVTTVASPPVTVPPSGGISPDGHSYAFTSASLAAGSNRESINCDPAHATSTACGQVFEFDSDADHLECASCGAPSRGQSLLGGTKDSPEFSNYRPRAVANGGYVYFETPNALSPRDSNGRVDVYQWHDGQARLISTGTSDTDSNFADVSGDGRDVFFKTSQSLVAQDTDNRLDLYDARLGGGIAAQNQAAVSVPCEGEACRGPSPSPPSMKTGAAPECKAFAAAAKRADHRAKALGQRAKKARGRRARKLRSQARGARHQAAHLKKENGKCGRQGR